MPPEIQPLISLISRIFIASDTEWSAKSFSASLLRRSGLAELLLHHRGDVRGVLGIEQKWHLGGIQALHIKDVIESPLVRFLDDNRADFIQNPVIRATIFRFNS